MNNDAKCGCDITQFEVCEVCCYSVNKKQKTKMITIPKLPKRRKLNFSNKTTTTMIEFKKPTEPLCDISIHQQEDSTACEAHHFNGRSSCMQSFTHKCVQTTGNWEIRQAVIMSHVYDSHFMYVSHRFNTLKELIKYVGHLYTHNGFHSSWDACYKGVWVISTQLNTSNSDESHDDFIKRLNVDPVDL